MSDWGHESEDLFRAARQRLTPPLAARVRVRAGIRAKLAGAATVAAAGLATSGAGAKVAPSAVAGAAKVTAAAKGVTAALLAKIVLPLAIFGAGIVVLPRVMAPRPAVVSSRAASRAEPAAPLGLTFAASPPVTSPEAIPSLAVDALPNAANAANALPRSGARVAAVARAHEDGPAPAAPPAEPDNATPPASDEASLVGGIDSALRAGDTAGALRLAAVHQRLFPNGNLTEEREGARVVARCMAGGQSPAVADAFLVAHPRSPMRSRIGAACGTSEKHPR